MKFLKKIFLFFWSKHLKKTLAGFVLVLVVYWFLLPNTLFQTPTSTVLIDKNGYLLGAKIAADGQWRFPHNDSVPYKFEKTLLEYEDRRFYNHIGIDLKGVGRAIQENYAAGGIRSGASTISMQVMRMSAQRKGRSYYAKVKEILQATRLELEYSKKDILAMYASNAPFGGNVVGLDAAAWRYYGKSPEFLSWGEAATLAVLPNSPGLIHPGRNRDQLIAKRNRLLDKIYQRGFLDRMTVDLAQSEPIPDKPLPLPRLAPHLVQKIARDNQDGKAYYHTTIDGELQLRINQLMERYYLRLKQDGIHNMAILVANTQTGEVLAYAGNIVSSETDKNHGHAVDVIQSPRSTGSILKPFLYASMLQEGLILPKSMIADVPMYIGSYRPLNFYENYDGIVAADRALVRSLNIPLVRMLQDYGTANFCHQLRKIGLKTITKGHEHYGLSLILGGAEATLWDLCGAYASMGRTLTHYNQLSKNEDPNCYVTGDFRPLHYLQQDSIAVEDEKRRAEPLVLSATSIYQTLEAMRKLERPSSEGGWKYFESSQDIAWKTGTSFGFRDAWAVGLTPEYTIGVWVGNATGEGRESLVGVKAAAPLLFDVFRFLPTTTWFGMPEKEMVPVAMCHHSGYRATNLCEQIDTIMTSKQSLAVKRCPYHQEINIDSTGNWQVHGNCEKVRNIRQQKWFILPPLEEYYYQSRNPHYKKTPPFRADCNLGGSTINPMAFIYPKYDTKLYLPKGYDGKTKATVFKITHKEPTAKVYWHLDNEYIGMTEEFHQLELIPIVGKHRLVVVDEKGNKLERSFDILNEE